jgi:hypothetical protein
MDSSAEIKKPLAPVVEVTPTKDAPAPKASDGTKANLNNALNLVGFFLSLSASYLAGVGGWFGGMTNDELNSKYQTLITPSAWYHGYIWALIFLSEGFFAVAQLLPIYRQHPLVQKGIGPVFFLACIAQTAWQIFFGFELLLAASVAIFALFLSLLGILMRQYAVINDEQDKMIALVDPVQIAADKAVDFTARPPTLSYWLLRFAFALHAGWVTTSTPVVLAMATVQLGLDAEYELWISCVSVPLIFGCCLGLLLREESGMPSYVFPGACAYAFAGIAWALYAPSTVILARHDEASITLMKNLSGFCGMCILAVMCSRIIAIFIRDVCIECKKGKKVTNKDDAEDIDGADNPYVKV